jgi:ParB family chromosome partitioning protein
MTKDKRKGLGKGLGALFGEDPEIKKAESKEPTAAEEKPNDGAISIKIGLIEANGNQPRKNFDEEKLKELAESIRQYGVLQPLLVQKNGAVYKIIAGERRWRAAQAAGLKEVPVVIRSYSPQEATEISIIENVQRADLDPVEEARAYKMLMDDYGLKQEEIAEKVSKDRTTITNALRLLKLDPAVQELMSAGMLSSGHARALLGLEDMARQKPTADQIISQGLSVRETEKLVKALNKKGKKPAAVSSEADNYGIFFREYEDKMKGILGTKVRINRKDKNKGRIEIEYYSGAELERIMDLFRTISH